jgi:hypothetical protein
MRPRLRTIFLALAALCAATLGAGIAARAAGGSASAATATVAFAPATSTFTLGVTPVPTVDVTVAQASGVAGYDAWVQFNGSVVHLNTLTDAGFLANPNPQGTPQNLVACSTPTVTATYGRIACSVLALPSPFPPPVLPSAGLTLVPIVHASFSAAAPGTSALSLTAVAALTPQSTRLLDINNTPIAATLGSGSITVTGAASVGGTAQLADVAGLPPPQSHGRHIPTAALTAAALTLLAAAAATIAARRHLHRR